MKRWTVNKRNGRWCVYDRGICWDAFDTLEEAHTHATQNAVTDVLWQPGGLSLLKLLKWAASPAIGAITPTTR